MKVGCDLVENYPVEALLILIFTCMLRSFPYTLCVRATYTLRSNWLTGPYYDSNGMYVTNIFAGMIKDVKMGFYNTRLQRYSPKTFAYH